MNEFKFRFQEFSFTEFFLYFQIFYGTICFANFACFAGWFSNLFSKGESTTTTTAKPESVDVTTEKSSSTLDGKKWFEMLTAHMATMQLPTPTSSTMNRTSVLRRMKYDDYQIWRIVPSTHAQLEFLREYKESDEHQNVLWLKGPAMRLFIFLFI